LAHLAAAGVQSFGIFQIAPEYNIDDADHLDEVVHSIWLGLEVMIGAHPAHSY
jgi:hypothetical protein